VVFFPLTALTPFADLYRLHACLDEMVDLRNHTAVFRSSKGNGKMFAPSLLHEYVALRPPLS
jgi:hypothetical protein